MKREKFIKVRGFACAWCGHGWIGRTPTKARIEDPPRVCPKCHSKHWDASPLKSIQGRRKIP